MSQSTTAVCSAAMPATVMRSTRWPATQLEYSKAESIVSKRLRDSHPLQPWLLLLCFSRVFPGVRGSFCPSPGVPDFRGQRLHVGRDHERGDAVSGHRAAYVSTLMLRCRYLHGYAQVGGAGRRAGRGGRRGLERTRPPFEGSALGTPACKGWQPSSRFCRCFPLVFGQGTQQ